MLAVLVFMIERFLQPPHKYIPHSHDVAHRTCEHEEMEDGVHISTLAESVERSTGDEAYALCHYPYYCRGVDAMHQRFESNEYTQAHSHVADGL